jgi:hypothetical protein
LASAFSDAAQYLPDPIARIFTPIVFGPLFFHSPTLCFCAAGGVVGCAAAVVLVRRVIVKAAAR